MTAAQLSIVARANMQQRLVDERRKAQQAGHGIATCGFSLECWRCGESGAVNSDTSKPGATIFLGSLATSKGCGK